jgi:23S rRNA (adenine2030-N6)-methyltransferase
MNYRHAYHAGNHADVLKHAVLARALGHLGRKDKAYCVIDAHAGIGLYDLSAVEAGKTGEWLGGVGLLYDDAGTAVALEDAEAEALLGPWREAVEAVNQASGRGAGLRWYPGSPEVAVLLSRPHDRLVFNELHPDDHATIAGLYARERRVRVTCEEAGIAVKANLPPEERRGIVLIDPPYEQTDDADRALAMLRQGHKRFATGCFMLWYPVTGDGLSHRLARAAAELALPRTLLVEMLVRPVTINGGLAGSGLLIVNPPWPLAEELPVLLPALAQRLKQGEPQWRVEWLTGE